MIIMLMHKKEFFKLIENQDSAEVVRFIPTQLGN